LQDEPNPFMIRPIAVFVVLLAICHC